jgi:hypothetical protein
MRLLPRGSTLIVDLDRLPLIAGGGDGRAWTAQVQVRQAEPAVAVSGRPHSRNTKDQF